jgi:hypothetical protein
MGKPRSARPRAGATTSDSLRVPKRSRSRHQASSAAGTVAARNPSGGMRSIESSRMRSMLAATGAGPWPEIAKQRPSRAS